LEEVVFDEMVSPDFSSDLKGELQELLPDVVSPTLGTFNNEGGATAERDEMAAGFLNALVSHTNALHNRRGGCVKPDGNWNTVGRVALNKVKTEDDFRQVIRSHRFQERQFGVKFSNRVRSVLNHYGYTAQDATDFADSSRYCLTSIRAHELYGRLLAYLEREVAVHGFKATKPIIRLFATELIGFRSEGSRLAMWMHTYVFLRNLYQNEFWTHEKQELINQILLQSHPTTEGGGSGGGGGGGGGTNKCNHCQGHAPGSCPFKEAGIGRAPSRRLARRAKDLGGRFATAARRVIEEHLAQNGGNGAEETKEDDGQN
jgi:virulence-associated protein VapD